MLNHEGRLTYLAEGYQKVEDFGQRWENETGLPLPLGLDVVRSDLGLDLAKEINHAMRKSIEWAYDNEYLSTRVLEYLLSTLFDSTHK